MILNLALSQDMATHLFVAFGFVEIGAQTFLLDQDFESLFEPCFESGNFFLVFHKFFRSRREAPMGGVRLVYAPIVPNSKKFGD